jgi:hypothetical protein
VVTVGGSIRARPAMWSSTACRGCIQMVDSVSPDTSRVSCPAGSAATKNAVSYRRGSNSGVIHRDQPPSRSVRSTRDLFVRNPASDVSRETKA